jgi:hypothetical protein
LVGHFLVSPVDKLMYTDSGLKKRKEKHGIMGLFFAVQVLELGIYVKFQDVILFLPQILHIFTHWSQLLVAMVTDRLI